jgi:ABC transport system ATP-binding/permease protein
MRTVSDPLSQSAELRVEGRHPAIRLSGCGPWMLGRGVRADVAFPDDPQCSREQLRITVVDGRFRIEPLSFHTPTHLNGTPLTGPSPLSAGDEIRFAAQRVVFVRGGPDAPGGGPGGGRSELPDRVPATALATDRPAEHGATRGSSPDRIPVRNGLIIGRLHGTDVVQLDHPNVSRRHAAVEVHDGGIRIRDLGSTNGTFVNGERIRQPTPLQPGDRVDIGPFELAFTGTSFERAERTGNVRLMGRNLTRTVAAAGGSGMLTILDRASVVIEPREFCCIIGPSGSGKSTLMNALSGREPATAGQVLVNDLDLYADFEVLKRDIAMVPQHNVLHEALSLRQALDYTGRLRLPTDLGPEARAELIDRVARSVELQHRLDARIATLSGGQKKRASLASETLNRPSVLFLDEVTSGLDESTDREIMGLLRQLAEDGMTIVCVTHTLANIEECCHKLIVMGEAGVLVFAGSPAEAKAFFGVASLSAIFDRLAEHGTPAYRDRFEASPLRAAQLDVLGNGGATAGSGTARKAKDRGAGRSQALLEPLRQFGILTARNVRLLLADRRGLLMAAAQSVVIGLLLGFAFSDLGGPAVAETSRGSLMLLLGLSALWLGCNGASKEIVGDLPIYRQERNVNLSTAGFVLSKFTVSGVFTLLQVGVVFALTLLLAAEIPGDPLLQLGVLGAGAVAGTALGLLISSMTDTRDQATTMVPLALVPQFILSKVIVPALPALAVTLSEIFVTGYWIVEAMRAVYVETEGPVILSPPEVEPVVEMTVAASSSTAAGFVVLHAVVFLLAAYALTAYRSRPKH